MSNKMSEWLSKNSHVAIYAILFIVTAIPLLRPMGLPITISRGTRICFDIIDNIEVGDIVLFDITFGPGSWVENGPSSIVTMKHVISKGGKIIFFTGAPDGIMMYDKILEQVTIPSTYEYGRDYAFLGYIAGGETAKAAFATDTLSLVENDNFGNPLEDLQLFSQVRSGEDIDLLLCATSALEPYTSWIRQLNERFGTTLVILPVGLIEASASAYVDAGQIAGILVGARGAAEYEVLSRQPGEAVTILDAVTMQHLLWIVFVVVGNVIYFTSKSKQKKSEGGV